MASTPSGRSSPTKDDLNLANQSSVISRSTPVANDAESLRILSYYQSADADSTGTNSEASSPLVEVMHRLPPSARVAPRKDSDSASEYSDSSPVNTPRAATQSATTAPSTSFRHKRKAPSIGGSDRRRLHIVETPSSEQGQSSAAGSRSRDTSPSALRSRRGMDGGLSLVAPPDASPSTYVRLSPPLSAPADRTTVDPPSASAGSSHASHARSNSEMPPQALATKRSQKLPREVGIVGTGLRPAEVMPLQLTPNTQLEPPMFQMPSSRSPSAERRSPHLTPPASHLLTPGGSSSGSSYVLTPDIGEGKQIHQRVAAPVVVSLSSTAVEQATTSPNSATASGTTTSPVFTPEQPSSYLHYQPGVHATAGPLPPPPRALFNLPISTAPPPRPPRLNSPRSATRAARGDNSAVTTPLLLPKSLEEPLTRKSSHGSLSSDYASSENARSSSIDARLVPELSETDATPAGKHTREGAFPPSTMYSKSRSPSPNRHEGDPAWEPVKPPPRTTSMRRPRPKMSLFELEAVADGIDRAKSDHSEQSPLATVVEDPLVTRNVILEAVDPPRPLGLEGVRQDGWLSTSPNLSRTSTDSRSSTDLERDFEPPAFFRRSLSRSPTKIPEDEVLVTPPSPNVPSSPGKSIMGALTTLKRYSSLPRTPSTKMSRRMSGSSRTTSTRTPSPSAMPTPTVIPIQYTPRPKIKVAWPSALNYSDVLTKKSSAERASAYAKKINELWMSDCGLGDWVAETKGRGAFARSSSQALVNTVNPQDLVGQPRQTSHGSMASEVTFPTRPDAYTATDLLGRPSLDAATANAPPSLPYPSLIGAAASARSIGSRSGRSVGSPASAKSGGGFFSSLGRKNSVSVTSRGNTMGLPAPLVSPTRSSQDRKVLSKQPPNPRPIDINTISSPTITGGPRAAPHRAQRSQTIMVSPLPGTGVASPNRQSSIARRPSMFDLVESKAPTPAPEENPEFARQVDQLADLLPQADRNVLAGYLRRSGQDILAIGQYLDDEKNGCVRRD